jgi:hypothetical protein
MIYIICNIYIYDHSMLTFNIHTGRSLLIFATDLQANVKCLINYPTGEDTPHAVTFMKRFGTPCQCCACTQRFDQCQFHP